MPGAAVRVGDYKLIERFEDGRVHLYNLANDPTQKVNVIRDHPEVAGRMKAELQRIRANPTAPHSKAAGKKK